MGRVIKFRAWNKKHKWMENGCDFYINGNGVIYEPPTITHDTPNTEIEVSDDIIELMQFTGLTDVNGVEIYEGDVVRVADYDDDERMFLGVVKFGVRGYPAFDIYNGKNETYSDEYNTFTNDSDLTFKVIGNVYQTPELVAV